MGGKNKIIAGLIFILALGTIIFQFIASMPKEILPGDPRYQLPGDYSPLPPLSLIDYLPVALFFITPLLFIIFINLIIKQKPLLGIKIIVSLMLLGELYIFIPSLNNILMGFFLDYDWILSFVEVFFITPLFFIASIGLWKMKKWGLLITVISLTIKFFISIKEPFTEIFFIKSCEWYYFNYLAIFIIICFAYLWKIKNKLS